jgi:TonB family protein
MPTFRQEGTMRLRLLAIAVLVLSASAANGQDATVYAPGNGVSLPRVVTEVKPTYTPEARKAGIEGNVVLLAVVLSDGTVGDVTVCESLDTKFGLDRQAVNAAKHWVFKPGMKDGKPVAVRVQIELTFNLNSK